MRLTTLLGALAITLAAPAAASVAEIDQDGDQRASFTELASLVPDLDKTLFAKIDRDSDGFVTDAEWQAAVQANLVETPAG